DPAGNLYFATGNGFGVGFNPGGPSSLGGGGGGLGYSGIGQSVAVTFRAYDHSSTGLGINGGFPGPNSDLGGATGIDFNAGAQAPASTARPASPAIATSRPTAAPASPAPWPASPRRRTDRRAPFSPRARWT